MNIVRETIELWKRYQATDVKTDYSDFDEWKKELLSLGFTEEEIVKISRIVSFNRSMEGYYALKRQQEEQDKQQEQEELTETELADLKKAELEALKAARIATQQTHLLKMGQDPHSLKTRTVIAGNPNISRFERPRKRR